MNRLPLGIGYAKAYRAVEKYVSFSVDTGKAISSADQRKISRYYKQFKKLTVNPTHIYKSRIESNTRFVQKQSGQPKGFPGFKVAFVPVSSDGAQVKIRIKRYKNGKRRLVVKDAYITRKTFLFADYEKDELETASNPSPVVASILKDAKGIDEFTLMCGNHESKQAMSRELLDHEINDWFERYTNTAEWFFGVIGYSFQKQQDINAYRAARNAVKRKRAKRRKKDS